MNLFKVALFATLVVMLASGLFFFIPRGSSSGDPVEIANEAYVYGLQQVVFYATRHNYTQLESSPSYAGTNRLNWLKTPITPEFKDVVTPNATTLYGAGLP